MNSSADLSGRLPLDVALPTQQLWDTAQTPKAHSTKPASSAFTPSGEIGASSGPIFHDLTEPPPAPGGGGNPGVNAGAPPLDPPRQTFSAADLSLMVSSLMSKVDDAQFVSENNQIKSTNDQRQEAFKKATDQIAEAAKKLAAANKKHHALGILGVIGKVLGAVAAVALTVATGGAAAPLAIALVTYAVVDASMSVADAISTAAGGPHLTLDTLMNEGLTFVAKKLGADDKTAKEVGQWGSFAIQAFVAVLMIGTSISGAVSLFKGASTAANLAKAGFTASKVVALTASAANGATLVTQGGLTIAAGVDTENEQKAEATKAEEDKMVDVFNELIQQGIDRLNDLVQNLSAAMTNASDALSATAQADMTITSRATV